MTMRNAWVLYGPWAKSFRSLPEADLDQAIADGWAQRVQDGWTPQPADRLRYHERADEYAAANGGPHGGYNTRELRPGPAPRPRPAQPQAPQQQPDSDPKKRGRPPIKKAG